MPKINHQERNPCANRNAGVHRQITAYNKYKKMFQNSMNIWDRTFTMRGSLYNRIGIFATRIFIKIITIPPKKTSGMEKIKRPIHNEITVYSDVIETITAHDDK